MKLNQHLCDSVNNIFLKVFIRMSHFFICIYSCNFPPIFSQFALKNSSLILNHNEANSPLEPDSFLSENLYHLHIMKRTEEAEVGPTMPSVWLYGL